jgi:hypothetical protein
VAHRGGIKLLARSTTNPGVDIVVPALNLREELYRKGAEEAARRATLPEPLDWTGAFTANTANTSTSLASVASLVMPAAATLQGAQISGTGIPAADTITSSASASSLTVSAAATATNTGTTVSFLDFILPAGYEAKDVFSAGALKRESIGGNTYDYSKLYDGFRERVRFVAAPGNVNVRVNARRTA